MTSSRRRAMTFASALGAALALTTAAAARPGPRPPDGEARERDGAGRAADGPGRGADRRRAPEPAPVVRGAQEGDRPLELVRSDDASSCHTRDWAEVRRRLVGLENESQVMSLEIWGDREVYHPGDRVVFYLRSPRAAYVTLWWLGPEGHTVVAMENARVPAERDVRVDTGGVVVPPLGRERWVAIATLEPVPLGCRSEAQMLRYIEARLRVEHGIGRWDVVSEAR